MNSDPREIIKNIVIKQLFGPSNDTFLSDEDNEIINDYPLNKYFTGIIFPKLDTKENQNFDDSSLDNDFIDDIDDITKDFEQGWHDIVETEEINFHKEDSILDDFSRNELYPNSFGLSFSLLKIAKSFTVTLSFGRYHQIDPSIEVHPNYKIELSKTDYEMIKSLSSINQNKLGDILGYNEEHGFIYLKRKLVGNSVGSASGDFADLREIKKSHYEAIKNSKGKRKDYFTKLNTILRTITPLYKKGWIRSQYNYKYEIIISELEHNKWYTLTSGKLDDSQFEFKIHIRIIEQNEDYSVIQLAAENSSPYLTQIPFIPNRPKLNQLCMFQSQIKVECEYICPLPHPSLPKYVSLEDKIIDCQYRNSNVFALAHNCSCSWLICEETPKVVKTEFLPSIIPPITTNIKNDNLARTLNIKNNSNFSNLADNEIIENLEILLKNYRIWIENQESLCITIESRYSEAVQNIVKQQKIILERMINGVEILKSNSNYMVIYKLANSTMLVNLGMSQNNNSIDDPNVLNSIYYHIFQLAFLLINIEPIVNSNSVLRKNSIDLLWFPTGGGKTEAYFLLTAFSLLYRRFQYGEQGYGTSVIMRYTLRLLTAQQFERASRMILALNFVCSKFMPSLIESYPYSIGLWIGSSSSPNKLFDGEDSASQLNEKIIEAPDLESAYRANKFPLTNCPWCGHSLIEFGKTGFNCLKNKFEIKCLNPECHFHNGLPIDIIDESLYNNPPSLLFATIDKFARLAWTDEASAFFGSVHKFLSPDLIIQDELHLISGPLGSITALFENVVEMLCSKNGNIPRIIASTATIKNASAQVKGLFGNRNVVTFPPPGVDYNDNFFTKLEDNNLNREYIGIYPTGKTFTTTQVKLHSIVLFARLQLFNNTNEKIDNYWTIVSYYNSLRELGRMYGKIRDEVQHIYSMLVLKNTKEKKIYWLNSPKELTSRISGYEIKNVLHSLERVNIEENNMKDSLKTATDIVFATNMISVGLDIERLNIMILNGQPKSISEYIQVTSRIARKHPGLIFILFNPFKIRDKSHYENFSSFHNNYYRFVEPISITPYTRIAITKLMPTLLAAYLRQVESIKKLKDISQPNLDRFISFMKERINDEDMSAYFIKKINEHITFLQNKLSYNEELEFKDLLINTADALPFQYVTGDWLTMNSMREINPNTVIKIVNPKNEKRRNDYD